MITIHEATASDFSTLGLGALMPSECIVEEKGGGLYELTLVQPFTADLRHELLKCARIIKAPAPVRETPLLTINATTEETVRREIYKVETDGRRLNMRTGPGTEYKTINAYKPGTELIRTEVQGDWAHAITLDGGTSGWMWAGNLKYVRVETEVIVEDSPGTVVKPRQTRDQLFRIYEVEPDSKLRTVTVRAQHISYDLKGALVVGEYAPENVAANTVCAQLIARADHNISDFNIYCGVTDKISGDYTDRNLLDCLLDPETGVVAQTHARVVRDNYDIFILPGEGRERGVELRYGKNLLSASMPTGTADLITRIRPVGKDGEGNPLYITKNNGFVDSPRINDYPVIYAKRVEYDVLVGEDMTEDQARAELEKRAKAEFEGGCDLPSISVDADFVRLDLTEEYRELASAYALHLYDLVPVIDRNAGIIAKVRMTGYKYDAVLDRYESTELGDIAEADVSVYGYELAGGSISGGKIVPNSMSGDRIRNLSIGYAKMDVAAIRQLSADAITAVRADIRKLVADEITTDQLYADLAVIAAAQITAANIDRANIQWAEVESLVAEIADIVNAEIGTADIDYARIKDMVTDTAIITEGVGGKLYINRLAVTEANMVQLTVGALMLKAEDGSFVQLVADGAGNVTTQPVTVEGDNIASNTISGSNLIENTITARELNVGAIFADSAMINAIKAANIDVADLFAANATIAELDNYLLKTSTIEALSGKLSVWADERITLAVNAVQIGGANYLLNSGTPVTNSKYEMADYPLGDPKPVHGETYTLRLWGKLGEDRVYFQPYNSSGTLPLASKLNDNGDGTYSATFKWKNSSSSVSELTPTFLRIYQRNNTGTSESTITRIKLEAGNRATDWSQHPEEFRAGTSVTINKDQFSVTTPEFNVNITSEDGAERMLNIGEDGIHTPAIDCPNVMERYDGPDTLYVNPNASAVDGVTYFWSLNDVANKLNRKFLPDGVTINLTGTVVQSKKVTFYGISSGDWVTLKGTSSAHAKIIGQLNLCYNSAPFKIQYVDIDTISSGLVGVEVVGRMQHAEISNCIITGRGDVTGAYGVNSINGAYARVVSCELYDLRRSFRAGEGGLLTASNCKGNCSPGTNLSNMHLAGTQACSNASTWTEHPSGGEIYKSSVTINQGSKPSPEPEATSVSYNATNSDVYAGGGWNNYSNSDIYQGYTDALGEHRGCFWFNNSTIRSALKNKTIKQATLTLYQVSGVGRNQPVQVNLEGITATSGTGNSPTGKPEYGVIGTTLGVGKATTFTIPTKVITDLVNSTINGFMLRTGESASMKGDDNSYNYARFAGFDSSNKPVLTVTYA